MTDEPTKETFPVLPGDSSFRGIFKREAELAKLRKEAQDCVDIPVLEDHRSWSGPAR